MAIVLATPTPSGRKGIGSRGEKRLFDQLLDDATEEQKDDQYISMKLADTIICLYWEFLSAFIFMSILALLHQASTSVQALMHIMHAYAMPIDARHR